MKIRLQITFWNAQNFDWLFHWWILHPKLQMKLQKMRTTLFSQHKCLNLCFHKKKIKQIQEKWLFLQKHAFMEKMKRNSIGKTFLPNLVLSGFFFKERKVRERFFFFKWVYSDSFYSPYFSFCWVSSG